MATEGSGSGQEPAAGQPPAASQSAASQTASSPVATSQSVGNQEATGQTPTGQPSTSLTAADQPLEPEVPVDADPAALEAGDDRDDADSAFDSESLYSTDSLTPSILEYRQLHGRTYANAKTGDYWGPNDEQQSEGLDLIHNALTILLKDKLFLAPITERNVGRVLDIGTGTGIWAMDFGDEFPNAEVIGTDLSPMMPQWVPPNVKFEVDDCLLEWTWPENHFDFIHIRCMYGAIPDWTELDTKVLKHLKPGGWFEHVEIGCQGLSDHVELPQNHTFDMWASSFYAAGEKMGRPFTICLEGQMKKHMVEAGFVDITEVKLKLPVNSWARDPKLKHAGMLFHSALERDMEGFSLFALTQILGWSREEVLVLVAKMRQEIRKKSNCPYITVMVVYGRKPY